jgi:release factor glutamine methyltransferase
MSRNQPVRWRELEFETDDENVYAPKPASLLLAEQATSVIPSGARVLDACTGSGVVGIAVAKYVADSQVAVSDINQAALDAARRNARRNQVAISVVNASLYDGFTKESFDVITVHPPAVPYPEGDDWGLSAGMRIATNGGDDGSRLVIRSIAEAKPYLKKGGKLLLLLPHWSNLPAAREALSATYRTVDELARKQVEFFPVAEGRSNPRLLEHVKALAARGIIEMTFDGAVPLSVVSVVQASN